MIRHVFNENNFGKSILDLIDEIVTENGGTSFGPNKNSEDLNDIFSKDYDIYEDSGERHFEFALPGFDKKDIRIELTNDNFITVGAKRAKEAKNYIERNSDNIKKYKLELTPELAQGDFRTSLKDGILTVSIKPTRYDRKFINID